MPRPAPAPPGREGIPASFPLPHMWRNDFIVLGLCVVWALGVAPFAPGFLSPRNGGDILISLLPLLLVATGQTLVMVSGGIDLSLAAIIGLASVLGSAVMSPDYGLLAGTAWAAPAGVLTMLAVGAAVGAINGIAVAWLRMPPFIVTLATMMFASGAAVWFTHSQTIGGLPTSFIALGSDLALALPMVGLTVLAAHLLLARTLLGRWLQAVGYNARASAVSGVPVSRATCSAYVLSGLTAGLAAVLYSGRLECGSPVHGQTILLDVIGATVIGGTSLFGGKGRITWTIAGALFLTLVDNSLNKLNLSYPAIMMVKGGVILGAAAIDAVRTRKSRT